MVWHIYKASSAMVQIGKAYGEAQGLIAMRATMVRTEAEQIAQKLDGIIMYVGNSAIFRENANKDRVKTDIEYTINMLNGVLAYMQETDSRPSVRMAKKARPDVGELWAKLKANISGAIFDFKAALEVM